MPVHNHVSPVHRCAWLHPPWRALERNSAILKRQNRRSPSERLTPASSSQPLAHMYCGGMISVQAQAEQVGETVAQEREEAARRRAKAHRGLPATRTPERAAFGTTAR